MHFLAHGIAYRQGCTLNDNLYFSLLQTKAYLIRDSQLELLLWFLVVESHLFFEQANGIATWAGVIPNLSECLHVWLILLLEKASNLASAFQQFVEDRRGALSLQMLVTVTGGDCTVRGLGHCKIRREMQWDFNVQTKLGWADMADYAWSYLGTKLLHSWNSENTTNDPSKLRSCLVGFLRAGLASDSSRFSRETTTWLTASKMEVQARKRVREAGTREHPPAKKVLLKLTASSSIREISACFFVKMQAKKWRNKTRVLVFAARGVSYRYGVEVELCVRPIRCYHCTVGVTTWVTDNKFRQSFPGLLFF